ncbi:MRC1-like domain-containing protein [Halteromyces radiatus]|uniref:MRC1-like domain-containing protein n=1 Tax=Halteromyces radiatus TaxID=101107 RepID=UPI00221ED3F8|nr:MRC1-like domain-containing protein [Halteromyces radiatus]KAI8076356.1 MRC1-like domain-containing protein [Halteromyces radiatus]
MKTAKQRHHWDDDDEDDHKSNKIITKPVPEPVNSIAKFFSHRTDTSIQAENDETNDGPRTLTRLMQRTLIEDDEKEEEENHEETDEEDDEEEEEDHEETEDIDASATEDSTPKQTIHRKKERNDYVEEEAEEEEDEYYGLGGPDIAETEDLDQYEDDDMLVADNYEKVDNLELQAEYHKKMLESDQHEVERLIKDVTSGGLRRKRGAAAAGLLLDDYDLHDDYDQDDLVALRLLANRRKKTMMKGGDPMQHLASDPKTVAFAKAALPAPGTLDLSDDDEEEEEEEEEQQQEDHVAANNMKETTDDDDILPSPSIHLVIGDTTQVWTSDKKTIS